MTFLDIKSLLKTHEHQVTSDVKKQELAVKAL